MRVQNHEYLPELVEVITEDKKMPVVSRDRSDKKVRYCAEDIVMELCLENKALTVQICAKTTALCEILLTWKDEMKCAGEILGDCWERSYGDMEWQSAENLKQGQTINGSNTFHGLPWYFLDDRSEECIGYGVKVRPSAMCWWELKQDDLILHLNVRCGSRGVNLNGRWMNVATVLMRSYQEEPFKAAQYFCEEMCQDSIYDGEPLYGSNNWYYAYGNSSREEILLDTEYLAKLTCGLKIRPFMVIDNGWQVQGPEIGNGGPWHTGNHKFGDMKQLAEDMKKYNVRPGIWFRPLYDKFDQLPREWKSSRDPKVLDISQSEVLAYIEEDLHRIAEWGFELVKHDFSTWDIFGRWGFEMGSELTDEGWSFKDTSRTTAEIIISFYEMVYKAAKNMIILGCNCIGHLGAGLMHANRIGDDTSGLEWERTRKMGINTLAFRMSQHETFYAVDADCVGITEKISWDKNKQWMNLLAESGTMFFVSVRPGSLNSEQEKELKEAYQKASVKQSVAVPLDWKVSRTPCKWKMEADSKICRYIW